MKLLSSSPHSIPVTVIARNAVCFYHHRYSELWSGNHVGVLSIYIFVNVASHLCFRLFPKSQSDQKRPEIANSHKKSGFYLLPNDTIPTSSSPGHQRITGKCQQMYIRQLAAPRMIVQQLQPFFM
ncbi:hypothetical protein XENTR_v10018311 [Xenopus tropicalis]|nr:hypothetical protein XENTR_v10018311 [Xenopus tropicalis]